MELEPLIEPVTCPLCGGRNDCVLVCGGDEGPCWCESLTFPDDLREKIPVPLRDLACVCRDCVERVRAESTAQ